MKIPMFLTNLLNRRFNTGMDAALKRANKLHQKKGQTVVCKYCGGLLPKSDASVEYDIEKDQVEYCHEECFEKCAPHGTLEDMMRNAEQEAHNE